MTAQTKLAVRFWIGFIALGLSTFYLPDKVGQNDGFMLAQQLVFLFLVFWWFRADCEVYGRTHSRWQNIYSAGTAPFGTFYFKAKYGGLREAVLWFVRTILLGLFAFAGMIAILLLVNPGGT